MESLDNSGASAIIPTTDTIPAKAYTLALTYHGTKEDCSASVKNYFQTFHNSCYAFKCDEPMLQSTDTVDHVIIRCTEDFDSEHLAGDDLSELFFRKSGFIHSINWYPEDRVEYYLMFEPSGDLTCRFYVDVQTTDGRVFSDTTQVIVLN